MAGSDHHSTHRLVDLLMVQLITPVRFLPDMEVLEPHEAETTQALADTMQQILDTTYKDYGHAVRSVHAKSHCLLEGELEILSGLPQVLAQGLFAQVGTHPVIMRYSTNPGDLLDDKVSAPRGLAIKILDIVGERLPHSEGDRTQDFVMINGPAFAAPNAAAFLKNLKLLAATTDKAEGLKILLSQVLQGIEKVLEAVGTSSSTVVSLGGHPQTSVIGETFYTQAPVLYGPYIAKLCLVPVSEALCQKTHQTVDLHDKPDGLRADAVDFFASHDAMWELRVQLCTDIDSMPIEDASVVWDEDISPYVTVARLRVQAQSAWNATRAKQVDDGLAFSPWHGIKAHRPLGSIMRARQHSYQLSAAFRARHNDVTIAEPRCPFHLG